MGTKTALPNSYDMHHKHASMPCLASISNRQHTECTNRADLGHRQVEDFKLSASSSLGLLSLLAVVVSRHQLQSQLILGPCRCHQGLSQLVHTCLCRDSSSPLSLYGTRARSNHDIASSSLDLLLIDIQHDCE